MICLQFSDIDVFVGYICVNNDDYVSYNIVYGVLGGVMVYS